MKRSQRITHLKNLLEAHKLGTHQEILSALAQLGIRTNQAAISRDLKKLNASKHDGHYALPVALAKRDTALIQSLCAAGESIIVVKTSSGAANAVAVHIDQLKIPTVVGTIAGDDTIFVATLNKNAQKKALKSLADLSR